MTAMHKNRIVDIFMMMLHSLISNIQNKYLYQNIWFKYNYQYHQ